MGKTPTGLGCGKLITSPTGGWHCGDFNTKSDPIRFCSDCTAKSEEIVSSTESRARSLMDTFLAESHAGGSKSVFTLEYSYYDCHECHHLLGPATYSKGDFVALCNKLVPIAAKNLLNTEDSFVGWDGIVDELISILKEHGFEKQELPGAVFGGPGIIDKQDDRLGDACSLVIQHNKKIRDGLTKRLRNDK